MSLCHAVWQRTSKKTGKQGLGAVICPHRTGACAHSTLLPPPLPVSALPVQQQADLMHSSRLVLLPEQLQPPLHAHQAVVAEKVTEVSPQLPAANTAAAAAPQHV